MKSLTLLRKKYDTIAPYVTFKIDRRRNFDNLKRSERDKISRYFDRLNPLLARPFKIFRARNKEHLKIARNYSGHTPEQNNLRQLKPIAFIPVANSNVKILIKNGKLILKYIDGITAEIIEFDKRKLAKNPDKEVSDKIAQFAPDAKSFTISVGENGRYEVHKSGAVFSDKRNATVQVKMLMAEYNEKKENNYWKNWLYGLKAYSFTNQENWVQFRTAKANQRKKFDAKRKKFRRKMK